MGKRKDAQAMTDAQLRQVMLRGVTDDVAVCLYDEGVEALRARGEATFFDAMQLRDAALWTVAIREMHEAMLKLVRSEEPEEKRIAAIIRNKKAAEDARRDIFDGLLLLPQKKRGRPQEPKPERPPQDDGGAAWDAFDGESEAG